MRRGGRYKEFLKKFKLREVSVYCYSRHKSHLADQVDAGEKILGALNERNLRGIVRSLRTLAARSEKSGRPIAAIRAYESLMRAEEILQKRNGKDAGTALPAPVLNITFRLPEELEARRLAARAEIQNLDPQNEMLTELVAAEQGIVPAAEPKPRAAKPTSENLGMWTALGKEDLPN